MKVAHSLTLRPSDIFTLPLMVTMLATHTYEDFNNIHDVTKTAGCKIIGKQNIARGISDPALRAKVTPNWKVGCKRILLSNTYRQSSGGKKASLTADPENNLWWRYPMRWAG